MMLATLGTVSKCHAIIQQHLSVRENLFVTGDCKENREKNELYLNSAQACFQAHVGCQMCQSYYLQLDTL